jgi:Protein of unknown function (DUF3631)
MIYPPKPICERVAKLWALSRGSSFANEGASAFAALKRLQSEHELSDVELTFVAELYVKGDPEERDPDLLQLLLHFFEASHIVLSLELAVTVALWGLHAYVVDRFLHSPSLLMRSFEPGVGKSVIMNCLKGLIPETLLTSNTSAAALYHRLRKSPHTTFLIDEVESSELHRPGSVLVAFIDASWRQGQCLTRLIGGEEVEFPCFCPLALAVYLKPQDRRPIPDQVLSRSIICDIVKDARGRDELWPGDPRFGKLRGLISEWAGSFKRPENFRIVSRILTGRSANNWQPLLEIAETLGYGATALVVAETIERATINPITELFWDLRRVFEPPGIDRLWTGELLEALHRLEGSAWDEFLGVTATGRRTSSARRSSTPSCAPSALDRLAFGKASAGSASTPRVFISGSSSRCGVIYFPTHRHRSTKSFA